MAEQKQQQLQKEVNDYVIVFMDKSVLFITKEQAEKIDMISSTPGGKITGVDIGGGHYKFSMMAKVISSKDYYNQYSDRRPSHNTPEFESRNAARNYRPDGMRRMWESSIRGLKKYIESKGGIKNVSTSVKERLQKMEGKLTQIIYGR